MDAQGPRKSAMGSAEAKLQPDSGPHHSTPHFAPDTPFTKSAKTGPQTANFGVKIEWRLQLTGRVHVYSVFACSRMSYKLLLSRKHHISLRWPWCAVVASVHLRPTVSSRIYGGTQNGELLNGVVRSQIGQTRGRGVDIAGYLSTAPRHSLCSLALRWRTEPMGSRYLQSRRLSTRETERWDGDA